MISLVLDYLNVNLNKVEKKYGKKLDNIRNNFVEKNHEMMGWIDYFSTDLFNNEKNKIIKYINQWKKMKINTIVVVGIGGSYNGVKAAIDFLDNDDSIEYIYLTEISSNTLNKLVKTINNKNFAVVVISKSGTTLETSINFRIIRELLYKKYKSKHHERIITITDKEKGILNNLSKKNNYKILTIPSNIGGRYSALTMVSLFLMSYKKINIDKVIEGFNETINYFKKNNFKNNFILQYVGLRHYLYHYFNLPIEIFEMYDESYRFIAETYKQLFAESECKHQKTIVPVISLLSNDLHSIGQMYQEGSRNFFQTTLYIDEEKDFDIYKSSFKNDDNLDYLLNKSINQIKENLLYSVLKAHAIDAKNQNILFLVNGDKNKIFGEIYAFLCLSAATSSYLSSVDPFDQPGVENYKKNLKNSLK